MNAKPFSALRRTGRCSVFAALALALACLAAPAGVPLEFSLLDDGDAAFLRPPQLRFAAEVRRLGVAAPAFAGTPTNRTTGGSIAAELADLRLALAEYGVTPERAEAVVAAHHEAREAVENHLAAREAGLGRGDPAAEAPTLSLAPPPPELPEEFRRYLVGSASWGRGEVRAARAAWTGILRLPAEARQYKSVWAAYMLGRSWEDEDPGRARAEYARTRRLAAEGFRDSDGLAFASLGREARLHLADEDWATATRQYLEQFAAGDGRAIASLRTTAARFFAGDPAGWVPVAHDPVLGRLMTAWLAAQDADIAAWRETPQAGHVTRVLRWAEQLEPADATDPALAELVALALFQVREAERAGPWLARAGATPVTAWLRARHEASRGDLGRAVGWLGEALRRVPDPAVPDGLLASLYFGHAWPETPDRAVRRLRGERGGLRLARGDFHGAIEDFLRSGHWADAAYVAERVLTVDELKAVVDGPWREPRRPEDSTEPAEPELIRDVRGRLRELLARRLVRLERGDEATAYFGAGLRPVQARLQDLLLTGQDESLPVPARVQAWQAAAHLVLANGLELLGTELAPDWALWGGQDQGDLTPEFRATHAAFRRVRPGEAELARARAHAPEPDQRFHYRYRAAGLLWAAAELLPDGDEAVRLLDRGGRWLMHLDPPVADFFYKQLVRRGRGTLLGDTADAQRWFPPRDALGRPLVTRRAPPVTESSDSHVPAPLGSEDTELH